MQLSLNSKNGHKIVLFCCDDIASQIMFKNLFLSIFSISRISSSKRYTFYYRQFRFTAYRQYSSCVHHYETLGKQMLKRNLYTKQTFKILMINNIYGISVFITTITNVSTFV